MYASRNVEYGYKHDYDYRLQTASLGSLGGIPVDRPHEAIDRMRSDRFFALKPILLRCDGGKEKGLVEDQAKHPQLHQLQVYRQLDAVWVYFLEMAAAQGANTTHSEILAETAPLTKGKGQ